MESKEKLVKILKERGVDISSVENRHQIEWLLANEGFERYPVCIRTFLDDKRYLGARTVRDSVYKKMEDVFGNQKYVDKNPRNVMKYIEVVDMEGIGGGKTFSASLFIVYGIYRLSCLISPQEYYGKSSLSGLYLMLMSTSEKNAKDVIFTEIRARILENKDGYFNTKFKPDESIVTQLNFPKNLRVIPGNSSEQFFVGYNIFMAVLDECDDHKKTRDKDYIEEGYQAIKQRITSRFNQYGGLMMIGSPKDVKGFMMRKYTEAGKDDKMYGIRLATWEALDDKEFKGPKFEALDPHGMKHLIPIEYQRDLLKNPERFWRDLGAIPSLTVEPFFTFTEKVKDKSNPDLLTWDGEGVIPVISGSHTREYIAHVDLGVNSNGNDHCGIAIGHIAGSKSVDEFQTNSVIERPYIVMDLVARLSAPSDSEIQISDVRKYLLYWKDLGVNYYRVQFDGWQSKDSQQILSNMGIGVKQLSVDKDMFAYEALKEAIYENRIEYGTLMVPDGDPLQNIKHDILITELLDLKRIKGSKVDHPIDGSKDVADAVAGVVRGLTETRLLHKIGVRYEPRYVRDKLDIERINNTNGIKERVKITGLGRKSGIAPRIAGGGGIW